VLSKIAKKPLAGRNPEAYKQTVSSKSFGGR